MRALLFGVLLVGCGAPERGAPAAGPADAAAPGEPLPADGTFAGLPGGEAQATEPGPLGFRGEGQANTGPRYPSLADLGGRKGFGVAAREAPPFDPSNHVMLRLGAVVGASPDAVRAVLRRGSAQLRQCYARAWGRDRALGGRTLVAHGRLGAAGLEALAVVPADFPAPDVPACLRGRMLRWEWPSGEGSFSVALPFEIS